MFRFWFQLIVLAFGIVANSTSPPHAQSTNTAPLSLFINGSGTVSPLTNAESLEVGQTYNMVATPGSGFAFSSWQQANVFTSTQTTIDATGKTNVAVSVVPSLVPIYTNQPLLTFTMQPLTVIFDDPGVRTITSGAGRQANFEPILLSIQLNGSAAILTWTNSGYTLQAAPAPVGVYTNISGALSPYTTNLTGPAQFFRLVSQ